MRNIFLSFLAIFNFNLLSMEKVVYFDVIHENNPKIVAQVSDEVALIDASLNRVDKLAIPIKEEDGEEDGFELLFKQNSTLGTVFVRDESSEDVLLKFSVQKTDRYSFSKVKFLEIAKGKKAILYHPSIGGGDNFVLAIGNKNTDLSVAKVQSVIPFGKAQFFIHVAEIENF